MKISVLVALCDHEARMALGDILASLNWRVDVVTGPEQATGFLLASRVGVVVVPYRAEGAFSWRNLLEEMRRLETPPAVVVTDPAADDAMWAEVLNRGGYDVLRQPFDAREVVYLLTAAWRFWYQTTKSQASRASRAWWAA